MPGTDTDAILARIDERLKALGLSDRQASIEAGGGAHAIRNIRKGSTPSVSTIEGIARALDVTPAFLAFGESTEARPVLAPPRPSMPPIACIPVVGQVAAGHWLSIDTEVDAPLYEGVPVPPDPTYRIDQQFAVEVSGTSINRVAPDGAILYCVDTRKARLQARNGELVIVEHRRNSGQEIMRTAKRYFDLGDRIELRPDSDDPRWQTPIVIERNDDPDDGTAIEVIGVVLRFTAPIKPAQA